MSDNFLEDIKAGNRVWMEQWRNRRHIETVRRITATQIVLGSGGQSDRYYRQNGYKIGRFGNSPSIVGIATPAECAEWDAKQATEHQAEQARQADQAHRQQECERLSRLFPEDAWVHEGVKGTWELSMTSLTTAEVEALAVKLAGEKKGA